MANVKISQLPEVTSLGNLDVIPSVASSITSQITVADLAKSLNRVTSSISASYSVSASHVINASPAFPYVGTARITGSLILSGSYVHGPDNTVSPSINNAFVQGTSNQVSEQYGFVQGQENIVSGLGGHAEGFRTNATAQYFSHAEGLSTTAAGNYSHAEGSLTSTGINAGAAHAEGNSTQADAQYSHTEGYGTQTTSTAEASHAEGYYTIARGKYQHVQGQYNLTSSVESAFIVGNGTSDFSRSNLIFTSASVMQITGSVLTTGSLISTGSIQTNRSVYADVAHYANSFQPYNGGYGKLPLNPVNPNVTASAAISWWASNQGASVASFGPGAIDVVYYCDQNLGQIGLYNTSNFQNWAGSIKFINNNLTTDITNGKVPYHVLITDNATLTDNNATIFNLEANNRRHVLGVTGSFLASDGASIGTNIRNQHFITGSVLSTGSFAQNGHMVLTQVSRSLNFADDAAAATGGVPLGGLYRNGNAIQIRLV